MEQIQCDILIAGASTGGTAAAIAAASSGVTVCLIEETSWLGGQLTVQGVSTPDEHKYIEQFGSTSRYNQFRQAIRKYYKSSYKLTEESFNNPYLNPGNCWVSYLSFEPKVGLDILREMTAPLVSSGHLKIFYQSQIKKCVVNEQHIITEVIAQSSDSLEIRFKPQYVLDATDLGDLLPLCGKQNIDWCIGAESFTETGEPDAPQTSKPDWIQPFTFPFAIDWSPDTRETNIIDKVSDYDELKKQQKYHIKHGSITGLFQGDLPWWSYRRLLAKENFQDSRINSDLCIINTAGNDYYGGNIIGTGAENSSKIKKTLERGRQTSIGYLYWLQTECPREDNPTEKGYPEIRLRTDVFDTQDGCAPKPYIRESRRIKSLRPIYEQEIVVNDFKGNVCRGLQPRAVFMNDSVGIGYYHLDIHPNGHGEPNAYVPTSPFQIPLGALIPKRLDNFLPACKNIGTTHLTNGAYRLHPIEWNIGESAGLLAAFCLNNKLSPRQVYESKKQQQEFQLMLLENGIPLNWYIDVPLNHFAFKAVQILACTGLELGNNQNLLFYPDKPISQEDWKQWLNFFQISWHEELPETRAHAACTLAEYVSNDSFVNS